MHSSGITGSHGALFPMPHLKTCKYLCIYSSLGQICKFCSSIFLATSSCNHWNILIAQLKHSNIQYNKQSNIQCSKYFNSLQTQTNWTNTSSLAHPLPIKSQRLNENCFKYLSLWRFWVRSFQWIVIHQISMIKHLCCLKQLVSVRNFLILWLK